MRVHPCLLLLSCLAFSCVTVEPLLYRSPQPDPLIEGKLLVIGGGGTTPPMIARMLELAGGSGARILILPQASELPDRGSGSVELWKEAGATQVMLLDPLTEADGERLIGEADLIWLPGGDQVRLMDALNEVRLVDDIQRRYRQGALVAGTSAGAAVMSPKMITGEADLESVHSGGTQLVPGLGLWHDVIVDQHFVRRQRWARLISAVLDHPELVGVGIDERTAVEVFPAGWRVWGEGTVVVIDARRAEGIEAAREGLQGARGVRMALLRDGDIFNLR